MNRGGGNLFEGTDLEVRIDGLNSKVRDKATRRMNNLTKPKGSLGKLEDLAIKIAGIRGELDPTMEDRYSLVFAGDHGVAAEGVSAYPQEVTVQMLENFIHEGAAINVLGKNVGSRVRVIDVGVASEEVPRPVLERKISKGTKNFLRGPAMSREEALESIRVGYEVVEELVDSGLDLLGVGDMGIGNTTPSSAITAVMTGESPKSVTGRGTGIDEESLRKKVEVVEKGLDTNNPDPENPVEVLAKVGGYEIGAIAGAYLAGAANQVPVLVDGFITTAGALIAHGLEPGVVDYLIASHCSVEEGHGVALDKLGLEPLLDLNLRLGEGTGAALAMHLVEASTSILNGMYTFEEAGVSSGG
ncbi:nicotinate-nucleotide--dimethylbenzimidazole phosphoribosyltransferase [Candidatus Bipolaricaulota bacterium]|nr:nicotinate-nucleotide--dimethylbenzimidazole phosphoribosyltransferase [Candidatus Bipolaricaulota bacterium]MBS3792275.1 nicotinate-nucleotide--dimethylbenzimidazole phosphoribosyltransferase [Candidatus Bipolaricaulota bacterium]